LSKKSSAKNTASISPDQATQLVVQKPSTDSSNGDDDKLPDDPVTIRTRALAIADTMNKLATLVNLSISNFFIGLSQRFSAWNTASISPDQGMELVVHKASSDSNIVGGDHDSQFVSQKLSDTDSSNGFIGDHDSQLFVHSQSIISIANSISSIILSSDDEVEDKELVLQRQSSISISSSVYSSDDEVEDKELVLQRQSSISESNSVSSIILSSASSSDDEDDNQHDLQLALPKQPSIRII